MEFPCPGCPKNWRGHRQCHCAGCHENFASVSAFDQHRWRGACRPPASRGMALGQDGCWTLEKGSVPSLKASKAA